MFLADLKVPFDMMGHICHSDVRCQEKDQYFTKTCVIMASYRVYFILKLVILAFYHQQIKRNKKSFFLLYPGFSYYTHVS